MLQLLGGSWGTGFFHLVGIGGQGVLPRSRSFRVFGAWEIVWVQRATSATA